MKREIKFKSWCPEPKIMGKPYDLNILETVISCADMFDVSNDIVFLQYTGLKDKNDKEIFEGDVLKINGGADDFFATVEFEHGCFVAVMHDKVEGSSNPELKYYQFGMSEVVGNIYESPELLNKGV